MYNNFCCRSAVYVDQQLSWLEQPAHNRLVRGSSPCWSTIYFLYNTVSCLLRNLFIIKLRIKRRLRLAFCDRDFRVKNHPPDNFSRRNCWSTIYFYRGMVSMVAHRSPKPFVRVRVLLPLPEIKFILLGGLNFFICKKDLKKQKKSINKQNMS